MLPKETPKAQRQQDEQNKDGAFEGYSRCTQRAARFGCSTLPLHCRDISYLQCGTCCAVAREPVLVAAPRGRGRGIRRKSFQSTRGRRCDQPKSHAMKKRAERPSQCPTPALVVGPRTLPPRVRAPRRSLPRRCRAQETRTRNRQRYAVVSKRPRSGRWRTLRSRQWAAVGRRGPGYDR
jgi:hypothetical protein